MKASTIIHHAAQITVHTTGVNWESIGVIIAAVSFLFAVVTFILVRRDQANARANTEIKQEITEAVNHLSEVLLAKLETKETVAQISARLARLEGSRGIRSWGRVQ